MYIFVPSYPEVLIILDYIFYLHLSLLSSYLYLYYLPSYPEFILAGDGMVEVEGLVERVRLDKPNQVQWE